MLFRHKYFVSCDISKHNCIEYVQQPGLQANPSSPTKLNWKSRQIRQVLSLTRVRGTAPVHCDGQPRRRTFRWSAAGCVCWSNAGHSRQRWPLWRLAPKMQPRKAAKIGSSLLKCEGFLGGRQIGAHRGPIRTPIDDGVKWTDLRYHFTWTERRRLGLGMGKGERKRQSKAIRQRERSC